MQRRSIRKRTAKRPDPRRQGMVLLIVLLILMMTTATATFAVHSTGYEIQAAGSMRQALRTRNTSEGMANAVMLHARDAERFCTFETNAMSVAGAGFSINLEKYGYPNVVPTTDDETVRTFGLDLIAQDAGFASTPTPADSDLSSSALATAYVPTAEVMAECIAGAASQQAGDETGSAAPASSARTTPYRVKATVFGETASSLDSTATGALRADHGTVSISRVYLNL